MWARQESVYTFIPASSLSPCPRRLYDNELRSSANQLRPWLQSALNMRRGGRGARIRSRSSSLCVRSSGCGRPGESCSQRCAIFLLLYRWSSASRRRSLACGGVNGRGSMNSQCYTVAMDLGVCQLRNFSISFLSSVLGKESASVRVDNR